MNHRVCHTKNMKKFLFCLATASLLLTACGNPSEDHRVVVCVPVYGQSLALGEETELVTNLDSLGTRYDGRIVTERLDHDFGYFDNNALKQWGKRLIGYKKHSFELSLYGMAETLAAQTGSDTLICIFPGGQGATAIAQLSKGTTPYERFMENIKTAADKAREKGWTFIVPAVCWMQGESDIEDYPDTDYKRLLAQFADDLNADVKAITGQEEEVRIGPADPPIIIRSHANASTSMAIARTAKANWLPARFLTSCGEAPNVPASFPSASMLTDSRLSSIITCLLRRCSSIPSMSARHPTTASASSPLTAATSCRLSTWWPTASFSAAQKKQTGAGCAMP